MVDSIKGTAVGLSGLRLSQAASSEQISAKLNGAKQMQDVDAAAIQFEALLLQQMMKAMWANVKSKDSLLGSNEEETFRDMFNQALSEEIAKGQGIGIKEVILPELRADAKRKK